VHEPEGSQYIFYNPNPHHENVFVHCISGFWGLHPQTPTGALPLNPAGGLLSPNPVLTLPPNPGYVTVLVSHTY